MIAHLPEGATIVVCEDDDATRELLCDHLLADRFRPLAAPDGRSALRLCAQRPDILLLDIVLPDGSGLDVLRAIRAGGGEGTEIDARLPVIVLSGRASDTDRLRGLAEGADDYLTKPFLYQELAARVSAILRRAAPARSDRIRIGPLLIDPALRLVEVGDRRVELANKEFVLLRVLASDPTRVFTKEELLREVWGYRTAGRTRTLDSHASRLRRKLDSGTPRFVVNCWGVGYRLLDPIDDPREQAQRWNEAPA